MDKKLSYFCKIIISKLQNRVCVGHFIQKRLYLLHHITATSFLRKNTFEFKVELKVMTIKNPGSYINRMIIVAI